MRHHPGMDYYNLNLMWISVERFDDFHVVCLKCSKEGELSIINVEISAASMKHIKTHHVMLKKAEIQELDVDKSKPTCQKTVDKSKKERK